MLCVRMLRRYCVLIASTGMMDERSPPVPLCYSMDQLYDWAEQLHTVATRIQAIAVKKDVKELWRLMEIKGVVDQLNKESEQDIAKFNKRLAEKKRSLGNL